IKTFDIINRDWHAEPIAFASDAGGESRKGRRIIVDRRPEIFGPDCFSHQLQLVVGDYVAKSESNLRLTASQADELISWIRGKTQLIFLLKEAQLANGNVALSVVRAAMTRWTSHHLAYHRLVELQPALSKVVSDDEFRSKGGWPSQIIKGDRKSKAKAKSMLSILRSGTFWHGLIVMARMLEPLAKAAYISQATVCRPDQVLLMFGSLFRTYTLMPDTEADVIGRQAILNSLEKRWSKCEQDVYIAAVILNPFIRMDAFKRKYNISQVCRPVSLALFDLFSKLFKRFFRASDDPEGLFDDITDYVGHSGPYASFERISKQLKGAAQRKV
ncbi:hypothetical protein HDZ31DRAFT_9135, partial [Schizophyllum fasciatum]